MTGFNITRSASDIVNRFSLNELANTIANDPDLNDNDRAKLTVTTNSIKVQFSKCREIAKKDLDITDKLVMEHKLKVMLFDSKKGFFHQLRLILSLWEHALYILATMTFFGYGIVGLIVYWHSELYVLGIIQSSVSTIFAFIMCIIPNRLRRVFWFPSDD